MSENKRKLKPIILAIIVVIIIIILILVFFVNKKQEENAPDPEQEYVEEEKNTLEECDIANEYFIVKNIIEQFYSCCNDLVVNESDIDIHNLELEEGEQEEYIKEGITEKEEDAQDAIYNTLSPDYIKEFNIEKDKLSEKFNINYDEKRYIIKTMYKINNSDNVATYLVKGILVDFEESKSTDEDFAVSLDLVNNTYYFYPEEYVKQKNYNKLNLGDNLEINIESIEDNSYNSFEYNNIEDNEISKEYFNNYRYEMMYNTEYAYNMLNEDYRNKRFGSVENYKKYVKEYYDYLSSCTVTKYQVTGDDSEKYVCLDNYGNYYIFNSKNICNYNLELDTYTVESEEFLEKYNGGDEKNKAGMNVEKFIEALNTKDYTYIYDHLAESFKKNNYASEDELKNYIEDNLFIISSKEYKSYSLQGSVYIFKLEVSNGEDEEDSKQKDITVMVRLKEDTDYELSFSIE